MYTVYLAGEFKYLCSPLFGEDSHFDYYFSNGLKNHQPDIFGSYWFYGEAHGKFQWHENVLSLSQWESEHGCQPFWTLVSWMPKEWSCRTEKNLHAKYQYKYTCLYIYIYIWLILMLLVSICAVYIWLSMSNPRNALCIAVLGKMHYPMCSRDRYYLCSDRIKRCSGAMFNNELLPLKWENSSTLPQRCPGRLRGKRESRYDGQRRRAQKGCQLVNPQLFPLKSYICQMWPICWTTWDVFYYNYGDMYVQVIVMLLDVTSEC